MAQIPQRHGDKANQIERGNPRVDDRAQVLAQAREARDLEAAQLREHERKKGELNDLVRKRNLVAAMLSDSGGQARESSIGVSGIEFVVQLFERVDKEPPLAHLGLGASFRVAGL